MRVEEFHYRIAWRASGSYPGHHRSRHSQGGFEFRNHAPLLSAPDPRRVDIRAGLRDPFGQLVVRVYNQKITVPVYALADLSASMGCNGTSRKIEVLADFVASLGYSAYRTGDPFGFVGCDRVVRQDLLVPLTRAKSTGPALAHRLRQLISLGSNAHGLRNAADSLVQQRSLVFLISDYYFSLELLEQVINSLSLHVVVPVVLVDSTDTQGLPKFGIARLVDSETGRQRLTLMRAQLRERVVDRFETHMHEVTNLLMDRGMPPLFIKGAFNADSVTRHFYR